jgi:Flp pilus assembly protein protease CpaA
MMPELSIFDSELSQRVFLLVTIMFIALYAGAFLFLRHADKSTDRAAWHQRTAASAMALAAAVAMLASALGLLSPSHGIASQRAGHSVDAQQTVNPF